jgi:hypothetical protein
VSNQHCNRCHTTGIQVGNSRKVWRRLICAVTPLRRYACPDCGHHGWTFAWLAPPTGHQTHAGGTAPAHR